MRLFSTSVAALILSAPVQAQTVVSAQVVPAQGANGSTANAARLVLAARVAAKLLPEGSYRKMMNGTLDQILGATTKQFLDIPARDLAALAGLGNDKISQMSAASLREVAAIMDPAFEERMSLISKTMMPEMIELMSKMEPQIREGLAEAYAARFDVAQLTELEAFFATPTGNKYASESMLIYTDPAMLNRMQAMMPEMMKAMPTIMEKVGKASEKLPKPRTIKELSQVERKRLADLLGVPVNKLK
jgi:Uncharacterized protein conserved in bacteria (DUF2059)